ncbi:unnamed protein product, partial [Effrenium voratum]
KCGLDCHELWQRLIPLEPAQRLKRLEERTGRPWENLGCPTLEHLTKGDDFLELHLKSL